jgi:hypothetical protein
MLGVKNRFAKTTWHQDTATFQEVSSVTFPLKKRFGILAAKALLCWGRETTLPPAVGRLLREHWEGVEGRTATATRGQIRPSKGR